MAPPTQLQSLNQEGRILLAIQSIKQGYIQSVRAAAMSYNVPETTLRRRVHGVTPRRDYTPNSHKLTLYKESALVQILEQDIYNFDKAGFAIGIIATTKLKFLSTFKEAFKATFIEQNIKSRFQATGLVLSPTLINNALGQLVKGAQVIMYSAVLLKVEIKALQVANEQKKRREKKRKRRIMQGGSLSIQEGEDILQSAKVDTQVRTEVASESSVTVGVFGDGVANNPSIVAMSVLAIWPPLWQGQTSGTRVFSSTCKA
ncbi:hypothetical protein O988_02312 [Pseudogymnoascus sp. VKM F-3808]|nr:hypothetical protein O988_02312 [Pseudogymnoascus sp. VKM F-3808]